MKELDKALREAMEFYFDKKLRKSGYNNMQEVWDIIEEHIEEIHDIARLCNKRVDDYIEDQENDYIPSRYDMMNAYDTYRENSLANM